MIAVGIDLGGTKVEAQVFDDQWQCVDIKRVPTAATYGALLQDMAGLVAWADQLAHDALPIGVGAAGLVNPESGVTVSANLPINGKAFPADFAAVLSRPVTLINDSQALAISEANFGAAKEYQTILALALGTGISGAVALDGALQTGHSRTAGEFGHIASPAHLVSAFDLPLVQCGCGQIGCIETLISGPGLSRIALTMMGQSLTPQDVITARAQNPLAQEVWDIWCALTGDLVRTLTRTLDPDCIVLGGGLSKIDGIAVDLAVAARKTQFEGFEIAPILLADGGDTSAARGAAFAAISQGARDD
jgi:predicted NBD/HSP70 family sugar kinase